MGIGDAYLGLVDLLSHNENCTDPDSPVECLIGFVGETTIQSIKRATDDTISSWYYSHSMIFVKNSHFVWNPSRQRKMRKKLGNLIQSPKDGLDDMLEQHLEEVQNLLLEKKGEFDEMNDLSSRTDEGPQHMATGLRSPPLPSASQTPKRFDPGNRQEGAILKSPKMPQMGLFSASPGPRSPIKRPPL
jgi:histone deacetylase 6